MLSPCIALPPLSSMSLIHKPQAGVAQPVRKQVIQNSIYENPSVTLDLIAKICAAQPSNSQEDFYSRYRSVTDRLKDSTKQSKNNSSWNDSTANDSNSSSGSLIRHLRKSENASLLFNRNFSKDYQESLNEVVQFMWYSLVVSHQESLLSSIVWWRMPISFPLARNLSQWWKPISTAMPKTKKSL